MIFKRILGVALAGLLLGALIIGCGASGEAPILGKKPQEKPSLAPQALEQLRKGQTFLGAGKPDEALKEFQEAVRLAPDSALAQYWLGRAYFYRQDKEQAEKAFKQALEQDPKDYQSMISLGRLYSLDLNKLDEAQKLLQQALDESPDNLEGRFVLGMVYALKSEKQKALNEFNFTFAKEGELALYHFEIGRVLEATKDNKMALQHYQRALVLNPKLAVAEQAIKRLGEESSKEISSKTQPAPKPGKLPNPQKKTAR
jgi:tetratricopeptide (TPR) repeat protein